MGGPADREFQASLDFDTNGRVTILAPEGAGLLYSMALVFSRDLCPEDRFVFEQVYGIKGGDWARKHEDLFARGYLRYVYEGRAPTPTLASAFEMGRRELASKYPLINNSPIDVPLTDEMRRVYGRTLQEEQAKRQTLTTPPTSKQPDHVGMKTLTAATAWVWIGLTSAFTIVYVGQYSVWPLVGIIPWALLLCRHTRPVGWWILVVACWLVAIPVGWRALSSMLLGGKHTPQNLVMLMIALPPFVTWLILKADRPSEPREMS